MVSSPSTEIEPHKNSLTIGQIANDFLDWMRQTTHERGYRENLVAAGQPWILDQIDDFQLVASLEIVFADPLQIRQRTRRSRRLSRDIEPQ